MAHRCLTCERTVSDNKPKCLKCLALEVNFNLSMAGVTADPQTIVRAIRDEAGV